MEAPRTNYNHSGIASVPSNPQYIDNDYSQLVKQMSHGFSEIFNRLDTLSSHVQRLDTRLHQLEWKQISLEQTVLSRIPQPLNQHRLIQTSAQEPPVEQPVTTNKRASETNDLEEPLPKKQEISSEINDIIFDELRIQPQTSDEIDNKYKADTILSSEIHIINQNTQVMDEQGNLLVVYIKKINYEQYVPLLNRMMNATKSSSFNSTTRGDAGGKFDASTLNKKPEEFTVTKNPVRAIKKTKSGKEFSYSNRHPSITLGYVSHDRNILGCRPSSKNEVTNFHEFIPFVKKMGTVYAMFAPMEHKMQKEALETHKLQSDKDGVHFQIEGTPFTSVTINHSKDGKPTTFFHRDKNTLKGSLACMFVYGKNYEGGETTFPELLHPDTKKPIAFDVRPGGFLIFNGNDLLHGNTPVKLTSSVDRASDRVSIIAYAQQILTECTRCKKGTSGIKIQTEEDSIEFTEYKPLPR